MATKTLVGTPDPDDRKPEEKRRGKRNVNGEGNIRQRPDGRWEGRAYVLTTDGREIRKSVYGSTWDEAHNKVTKLQADRINGRRVADSKMTVTAYLTYWLDEVARHRMRDTTHQRRTDLFAKHVVPVVGKKRLTQLTGADLRRVYSRMRTVCRCCALGKDKAREERAARRRRARDGRRVRRDARPIEGARCCAKTPPECCKSFLSPSTIKTVHAALHAAFADAIREGMMTDNPADAVRLDGKYRPKFIPWTSKEARQFLAAAQADRLYAVYAVALSLGLRRGEALGLRWVDVDLDEGVIHVRQSLQRVNGSLRFGPVKSDDSDRTVALPPACVSALERHREQQEQERTDAGHRWQDHGLVFTTTLGTPIEPRNIYRHFVRLCERAGVRRIRFHDLRHSCATLLYEQGVKLENIQDVLGHSSPTITKLIYVEVTKKVQRDAVDRLGYLFEAEDG